jgi:hypothetical protein
LGMIAQIDVIGEQPRGPVGKLDGKNIDVLCGLTGIERKGSDLGAWTVFSCAANLGRDGTLENHPVGRVRRHGPVQAHRIAGADRRQVPNRRLQI